MSVASGGGVSLPEAVIAAAFIAACRDELEAPKPGNVHIHAAGHGMVWTDFVLSAEAAAPAIARRGATVGARILGAIEATRKACGINTNLGIVLLCAPLARAAERGGGLRENLEQVLAELDVEDAEQTFRAIVLAAPGGLGRSDRHDVATPASIGLREAMREAAGRDRIAHQYATCFDDVFELGLPTLRAASRRAAGGWVATVAVHLAFLAAFPDSHIRRKHGEVVAFRVRDDAVPVEARFAAAAEPAACLGDLLRFDAELKGRGLNPGTSADLTVATLFAYNLMAAGQT
jgi:triphosphoribosyl-dephospho-CoA synthase